MIWNALDYPALVIPVSRVKQTLDVKRPLQQFYSEKDRKHYESCNMPSYASQTRDLIGIYPKMSPRHSITLLLAFKLLAAH